MPPTDTAAEAALHDQTQLLPKAKLIFVYSIMSSALLVTFIDQNGIGVLLPSIAKDLNAESTITWAATSAMISNTIFQVFYGRLSDLFGRKKIFLSALILLSLSDLACGLSVNATMLYVFRGLAGVAGGGVLSLSMMIVSDIVTLRERGKYQGILGSMVGLGNATGPLIAAAFAVHVSWRGLYYLLAPAIMCTVVVSWAYLPSNMPKLNVRETMAKIDFLGVILGMAAVILLLIPTSDGGQAGTPWDSPSIIAMFCVGGVCLIAFLYVEWKVAELPMMPLSVFRSPSIAAMMAQTFLMGAAFYSYTYFLPLYFQNVLGKSPLMSAVFQLPLACSQSPSSVAGGLYMSRFNRYIEVIWVGFGMMTLGGGLLILADRTISFGLTALFLIILGIGTGFVFQPTLVAMQAHCTKAQRAVITSNRNFMRSSGAAVGLAISTSITSNVLKSSLPASLSSVASSTFATPDLADYSATDRLLIEQAYADASRAVFIWLVPLMGIAFLLTIFIQDRGLIRTEEQQAASASRDPESPSDDVEKAEIAEAVSEGVTEAKEMNASEVVISDSVGSSRKPSMSSEKSGA